MLKRSDKSFGNFSLLFRFLVFLFSFSSGSDKRKGQVGRRNELCMLTGSIVLCFLMLIAFATYFSSEL